MTFKQALLFCLLAPIAAWENMDGAYHSRYLRTALAGFLVALLNVSVGLGLLCLAPILAPVLWAASNRKSVKAREAARHKAMDEDV